MSSYLTLSNGSLILLLVAGVTCLLKRKAVVAALRQLDWTVARYHFRRGSWISLIWNWCLLNVGRAAEGYLTLSVLYQGASLLPGVSTTAAMDNTVFIGQQLALDVGGMSLAKQARRTRAEGNEKQADLERNVGFLLISLMIANVVLAYLKHLSILSASWVGGIEAGMLILRSIMAVVYGYIVFSPTEDEDLSVMKTSDVRERLDQFSEQLQIVETSTGHQIQSLIESLQQMQSFQNGQAMKIFESLRHVEVNMQYTMDERFQSVESAFHNALVESLTPMVESLSTLPDLSERLEQMSDLAQSQFSTVTEGFQQVRITVEKQVQTLPQYLERIADRRVTATAHTQVQRTPKEPLQLPTKRTEVVSPGDFDRKQFVFDCLTEDAEISISEIQRRATERGQAISTGSISMHRKTFQGGLSISPSMKAIEGEIESSIEREPDVVNE